MSNTREEFGISRREYDQQRRTALMGRDEYDKVRRSTPEYKALMETFDAEVGPAMMDIIDPAGTHPVIWDSFRWDGFLDYVEINLARKILFDPRFPANKQGTSNPFYAQFEGFSRMRRMDPNRGGGPMVFAIIAGLVDRAEEEANRFRRFFRVRRADEVDGGD